jgi:hypothetical protein
MEKNQRVVLTIIALAQFMVVLDVTVVNGRRESKCDAQNGRHLVALGALLSTTGLPGRPPISTTHEAR